MAKFHFGLHIASEQSTFQVKKFWRFACSQYGMAVRESRGSPHVACVDVRVWMRFRWCQEQIAELDKTAKRHLGT